MIPLKLKYLDMVYWQYQHILSQQQVSIINNYVHFVFSGNSGPTPNPQAQAGNPMNSMFQTPAMQSLMQQMSGNPEMFQNMMQSPYMQDMMGRMVQSPDLMASVSSVTTCMNRLKVAPL